MGMEKVGGGPAFPAEQGSAPDGTWNQTFEWGMTLRDYFAAKALQGYLSTEETYLLKEESDSMAVRCYEMADAMLKARDASAT